MLQVIDHENGPVVSFLGADIGSVGASWNGKEWSFTVAQLTRLLALVAAMSRKRLDRSAGQIDRDPA